MAVWGLGLCASTAGVIGLILDGEDPNAMKQGQNKIFLIVYFFIEVYLIFLLKYNLAFIVVKINSLFFIEV